MRSTCICDTDAAAKRRMLEVEVYRPCITLAFSKQSSSVRLVWPTHEGCSTVGVPARDETAAAARRTGRGLAGSATHRESATPQRAPVYRRRKNASSSKHAARPRASQRNCRRCRSSAVHESNRTTRRILALHVA